MRGFVDLHCHWVAGIDDGAPSPDVGIEMLARLRSIGFDQVVATPHMRPGLFDNDGPGLRAAYEAMLPLVRARSDLPDVDLSSEHYFDDVVFQRIVAGDGLPYPGGKAVLLEFYDVDFAPAIFRMLFELKRRRVLPVIAHPERYPAVWKDPDLLGRLLDAGAAALLDTAALVGKYGRQPRTSAERLLADGMYDAACSDAHRPKDVEQVREGMDRIEREYGSEEIEALFVTGPRSILEGNVET